VASDICEALALGAALDEFEGGVVLITHDAHICHKVGPGSCCPPSHRHAF